MKTTSPLGLRWARVGTRRIWRASASHLSLEVRACPRGCVWDHEYQARGLSHAATYHDRLEDAQAAAERHFINDLRAVASAIGCKVEPREKVHA